MDYLKEFLKKKDKIISFFITEEFQVINVFLKNDWIR